MIEVVEPGALTSVQTAVGTAGMAPPRRAGWRCRRCLERAAGESAGRQRGWRRAARDHPDRGPTLRFETATAVAITGARVRRHARRPAAATVRRTSGARRLAAAHRTSGDGARGYLAIWRRDRGSVGARFGRRPTCGADSVGMRGGRCAPAIAWRSGRRSGIVRRWTGHLRQGPIRIVAGTARRAAGPGGAGRRELGGRHRGRSRGRAA